MSKIIINDCQSHTGASIKKIMLTTAPPLFLSLSHLLAVQGRHPLLHLLLAQQPVTRGAVGVLQSGLELALIFIIGGDRDSNNDKGTGDRCPGGESGSYK